LACRFFVGVVTERIRILALLIQRGDQLIQRLTRNRHRRDPRLNLRRQLFLYAGPQLCLEIAVDALFLKLPHRAGGGSPGYAIDETYGISLRVPDLRRVRSGDLAGALRRAPDQETSNQAKRTCANGVSGRLGRMKGYSVHRSLVHGGHGLKWLVTSRRSERPGVPPVAASKNETTVHVAGSSTRVGDDQTMSLTSI
jgi:hypothetical protein